LPADWPSLQITRIHLHDHVLDVRVCGHAIEVTDHTPDALPLRIEAPAGWTVQ
jgi:hypothetical protein